MIKLKTLTYCKYTEIATNLLSGVTRGIAGNLQHNLLKSKISLSGSVQEVLKSGGDEIIHIYKNLLERFPQRNDIFINIQSIVDLYINTKH